MPRTRNALFGVLGVHIAFCVLRVAHPLWFRATLARELTHEPKAMSSVLWDFAILSFVLTVMNVALFIVYAQSVRRTRAASLANAVWVMALVQLVLGAGLPILQTYSGPSKPVLLLAIAALLYWSQIGVFCTSVYRLVVPARVPFYGGYTALLVALAVVQSLFGWLDDGLSVTPMDLGAIVPRPVPVVTTAFEWLWRGVQALSVGVFARFIVGATRRLPKAPPMDARVFD